MDSIGFEAAHICSFFLSLLSCLGIRRLTEISFVIEDVLGAWNSKRSAAEPRSFELEGTTLSRAQLVAMTPLIRFILVNMGSGFLIGLVVGFAFILSNGETSRFVEEPVAAGMMLWGFAASFGMGALGTGLALLPYE